VARLGIATGQGHAAMIYQRFGRWWGRFSLADLLLLNFLTLVTEFAAIALAARHLGLAPAVVVPLSAAGLILLVGPGACRRWERMTLMLWGLNLGWFALAALVEPQWSDVLADAVRPAAPAGGVTGDLIYLVIAIVGTTIAPWQLFFQQSCVADKRLRFSDLKWARLDTFIGATFTIMVAGCMMLIGDIAKRHDIPFSDPAQMAQAIIPVAGYALRTGILIMMVNAAVLGTTTISLASSWAYGEVMGWPHSLQKSVKEAPGFYTVYAVCVLAAAGIVLIPGAPLQLIIISVQVLAGLMLPSAIIFLQLLLNDKELMGPESANKS